MSSSLSHADREQRDEELIDDAWVKVKCALIPRTQRDRDAVVDASMGPLKQFWAGTQDVPDMAAWNTHMGTEVNGLRSRLKAHLDARFEQMGEATPCKCYLACEGRERAVLKRLSRPSHFDPAKRAVVRIGGLEEAFTRREETPPEDLAEIVAQLIKKGWVDEHGDGLLFTEAGRLALGAYAPDGKALPRSFFPSRIDTPDEAQVTVLRILYRARYSPELRGDPRIPGHGRVIDSELSIWAGAEGVSDGAMHDAETALLARGEMVGFSAALCTLYAISDSGERRLRGDTNGSAVGDTYQIVIGGSVIGSAIGSLARVHAENIGIYSRRIENNSVTEDDAAESLRRALRKTKELDLTDDDRVDLLHALSRLTDELEKPDRDPGRLRRYWKHIKEIAPPVSAILSAAQSLAKLVLP